jgi:hypothetical protein
MSALLRKKEPLHLTVNQLFTHPDKLIGIKGDVCGILVGTLIHGLFRRKLMPLLAGHLASSAGGATGRINKK